MGRVGEGLGETPLGLGARAGGGCEHGGLTVSSPGRVSALVEELDHYPQDRAEIVFEILAELDRADDQVLALRCLGTLVAAGGVDGAWGPVEIAGGHFVAGRGELAYAKLAAPRTSRIGDPEPDAMAAELLAEQGERR